MILRLSMLSIRVLDPIRDFLWRRVVNNTDQDPQGVALFCNDRLQRGGMSVRVVPGPLTKQEAPKPNLPPKNTLWN